MSVKVWEPFNKMLKQNETTMTKLKHTKNRRDREIKQKFSCMRQVKSLPKQIHFDKVIESQCGWAKQASLGTGFQNLDMET